MESDEYLRRLDQHLARGNRIQARSNEVMARNEIALRDLREFLADQTQAMRELAREIVRRGEALTAEMRAQRQVLLDILHRPDGQSGPSDPA